MTLGRIWKTGASLRSRGDFKVYKFPLWGCRESNVKGNLKFILWEFQVTYFDTIISSSPDPSSSYTLPYHSHLIVFLSSKWRREGWGEGERKKWLLKTWDPGSQSIDENWCFPFPTAIILKYLLGEGWQFVCTSFWAFVWLEVVQLSKRTVSWSSYVSGTCCLTEVIHQHCSL